MENNGHKFNGNWISEIRAYAVKLRDVFGIIALKMGTEVEDNSFEEIDNYQLLFGGILPIIVKIGGPEARNDMRQLTNIGVSGFVAPMIESPYALKNHFVALKSTLDEGTYKRLFKAINFETITAFGNREEIFSQPEIAELDQVTIGRGDLSSSMGYTVDHPEVLKVSREICRMSHEKGLLVSVGGGVTPKGAQKAAEAIEPDKVNTRNVVISLEKSANLGESVTEALNFERLMLEYDSYCLKRKAEMADRRIDEIGVRLNR
jgi:HpcH/HpaI aldolase/citrate lyase family protein